MPHKRITLFAGHYGSGKTNIAVNYALALKKSGENVVIADLDIVNPYFRTKDSADDLASAGIRLISSAYANTNVDIPALPQELYSITDDRSTCAVLDIGGDDRGATALGRIAPAILEENDYEMLAVVNFYRPLTRTAEEALEVMREVEFAAHMPFTGIVNNSNLGEETSAEDILSTHEEALKLCEMCGLPLRFTAAEASLIPALSRELTDVFPLTLQEKYYK